MRRAGAVQSAVGTRAAQLAARIRDLRSGEPDAARVSRGTRRAPRTYGRRLADPVGSRRASRPADTRRADGGNRRSGVANRGSHGRATRASEGVRSDATTPRGPRGRSDVAVATCRALNESRAPRFAEGEGLCSFGRSVLRCPSAGYRHLVKETLD